MPIRLGQTPTTYRVAAHVLFTAAISQQRTLELYTRFRGEQSFVRKPAWLALRNLGMEIGVPV